MTTKQKSAIAAALSSLTLVSLFTYTVCSGAEPERNVDTLSNAESITALLADLRDTFLKLYVTQEPSTAKTAHIPNGDISPIRKKCELLVNSRAVIEHQDKNVKNAAMLSAIGTCSTFVKPLKPNQLVYTDMYLSALAIDEALTKLADPD